MPSPSPSSPSQSRSLSPIGNKLSEITFQVSLWQCLFKRTTYNGSDYHLSKQQLMLAEFEKNDACAVMDPPMLVSTKFCFACTIMKYKRHNPAFFNVSGMLLYTIVSYSLIRSLPLKLRMIRMQITSSQF
ncbi:hypothetical protein Tco_1280310 [Tanacetum coccineum]